MTHPPDIHLFCNQHGDKRTLLVYFATAQNGDSLSIEEMKLNFVTEEELPEQLLRDFPWDELDDFACRFNTLHRVTLELGSRDHFAPFVETAVSRLPRLEKADKLRYRVQLTARMGPLLKGTKEEIEARE